MVKSPMYDINKKFQISYMGGLLMCIAFEIVSMIQNLETIFDDIFVKTIFTSDISYHKI